MRKLTTVAVVLSLTMAVSPLNLTVFAQAAQPAKAAPAQAQIPKTRVDGLARDVKEHPWPDIKVRLLPSEAGKTPMDLITECDGTFSFGRDEAKPVAPGKYTVQIIQIIEKAEKVVGTSEPVTVTANKVAETIVTATVEIPPSAPAVAPELQQMQTGAVSGTATDVEKKPFPKATVQMVDVNGKLTEAKADCKGAFFFPDVAPGVYTIQVIGMTQSVVGGVVTAVPAVVGTATVSVVTGTVATVAVASSTAAAVAGVVAAAGGVLVGTSVAVVSAVAAGTAATVVSQQAPASPST